MNYYKNSAGLVFAYLAGDEVPPHLVAMTPTEVAAHLSPALTPEQFQKAVALKVDKMLDEVAQSWRYRDYISARAYANDPNPRFAAEAAALIAHGSACWTVLDDLEAAVLAGTAQMPATVDEVLALLPAEPERPTV